MARKKRPEVRERDLQGFKFIEAVAQLLERLHDDGCARDKAGNRTLHYDEYCMLVLLFLFNPIVSSLRAIRQASELKKVQKLLGCSRASLGSLSEATTVFDPERLVEIIGELAAQLQPLHRDTRLKDVHHALTLVDGSLLSALPKMAKAMLLKGQTGSGLVKWRLHTQFEVDRHIPLSMEVTEGSGKGEADERAVLQRQLQPDRCYVMDRGYAKFDLFNAIHALGSSYVCRIRDNSHFEIVESRPLTPEDHEAGILSDQLVQLGNRSSTNSARMDHPVRVIYIPIKPHPKRGKTGGGSAGHPSDGILRIVTNLLDVPAWVIALIYQYRWTIEIFFRFFKHVLGCRHLISHDENGIEIQTYCAIIACLLISLWTGRKPTLRTYEMVCYYFIGLVSEEELLAHLAKLKEGSAANT
ncbi:MAG TPA: IS4 family transposase [Pirellulales bacterium]|nr:IS4 family transposase [Pirellulales bacterium]